MNGDFVQYAGGKCSTFIVLHAFVGYSVLQVRVSLLHFLFRSGCAHSSMVFISRYSFIYSSYLLFLELFTADDILATLYLSYLGCVFHRASIFIVFLTQLNDYGMMMMLFYVLDSLQSSLRGFSIL